MNVHIHVQTHVPFIRWWLRRFNKNAVLASVSSYKSVTYEVTFLTQMQNEQVWKWFRESYILHEDMEKLGNNT